MLCSHAGCRALNDHPRNLDDEQMRELAARGGLLGLMLHPLAIGHESRTIDRVIDHLEHAVEVMGVDRVCLGGDFTTRLTQVLPSSRHPADGLMPDGLDPGAGIEGLKGPRTIRRCSPPSPSAAGRRRRSRRSRVGTCSLCCVEPSLHRALCPRANRRRAWYDPLMTLPALESHDLHPTRRIEREAEIDRHTSYLELFFDLVVVFAFTQVTRSSATTPARPGSPAPHSCSG